MLVKWYLNLSQEWKQIKIQKEIKVYTYENIEISKADCLGYFKMGSTVVMIWEKKILLF